MESNELLFIYHSTCMAFYITSSISNLKEITMDHVQRETHSFYSDPSSSNLVPIFLSSCKRKMNETINYDFNKKLQPQMEESNLLRNESYSNRLIQTFTKVSII